MNTPLAIGVLVSAFTTADSQATEAVPTAIKQSEQRGARRIHLDLIVDRATFEV